MKCLERVTISPFPKLLRCEIKVFFCLLYCIMSICTVIDTIVFIKCYYINLLNTPYVYFYCLYICLSLYVCGCNISNNIYEFDDFSVGKNYISVQLPTVFRPISSACNLLPNLLAQIARFRFCKNFALAKLSILLALRLPVMVTPLIMNHFYVWSVIVKAVAHIWAVAHTACQ